MIDKSKVEQVINNLLHEDQSASYTYWLSSKSKKNLSFTDEPWQSGLQMFEDEIRKRGFVPPVEIVHQYKMPYGFDEASFERYVFQ